MPVLNIPSDAFSHGQIKSKLWLCENFSIWFKKYLNPEALYTLHWFGSWVGAGPFLLLSQNMQVFNKINLYELNTADLQTSKALLDYWRCESIEVNLFNKDVNSVSLKNEASQIFINTACEHILDNAWLTNIPAGSFVVLQSTDMPHIEHINCPRDLNDFVEKYGSQLNILDKQDLKFNYPDKQFTRFMLFGVKK